MFKIVYFVLFLIGGVVFSGQALAAPIVADSFSTTWDTGGETEIDINLGNCADTVYWEEIGNESNNGTSTSCSRLNQMIDFPSAGQYRVDFSGSFNQIDLGIQTNRDKFRTVEQWGNSVWTNLFQAFAGVAELSIDASDVPDLSSVISLYGMFDGATNFNSDISQWDVSSVSDMRNVFRNATSFNQPLNSWDVSDVDQIGEMFKGASSFNQPLDSWDVSNVPYMEEVFAEASSFNQPLNSWDVSNVVYAQSMFEEASSFNQPLDNWNIGEPCPNISASIWNFFFTPAYACIGDDFDIEDIFADSALNSENYAATLQGWSELGNIPQNVNLGTVPTTYCDTAQSARDILVASGWIISDLGSVVCSDDEGEESNDSSRSTATRIGARQSNNQEVNTSTPAVVIDLSEATPANFFAQVRELINYLTLNEAEVSNLPPEESTRLIVALRNTILFILSFVPGV